jgi:hypothetical protein
VKKWPPAHYPLGPIYSSNKNTKMPLWDEKEIIANKWYFGLTSTAPHPTTSNQPSSASLPYNLCDDVTCTTHHRSFTSFKVKLGNPSPICFTVKQAARYRCVFTHRLHPLISFEVQIINLLPLGFQDQIEKSLR